MESKEELTKFIKDKFNISADGYSDEEFKSLITRIDSFLDNMLKTEQEKYNKLKSKLETEKMIVDSIISAS